MGVVTDSFYGSPEPEAVFDSGGYLLLAGHDLLCGLIVHSDARVINGKMKNTVYDVSGYLDNTGLSFLPNTVINTVLNEGLKNKLGNDAIAGFFVDVILILKDVTVSELLKRQVVSYYRYLFFESYLPVTLAEEVPVKSSERFKCRTYIFGTALKRKCTYGSDRII